MVTFSFRNKIFDSSWRLIQNQGKIGLRNGRGTPTDSLRPTPPCIHCLRACRALADLGPLMSSLSPPRMYLFVFTWLATFSGRRRCGVQLNKCCLFVGLFYYLRLFSSLLLAPSTTGPTRPLASHFCFSRHRCFFYSVVYFTRFTTVDGRTHYGCGFWEALEAVGRQYVMVGDVFLDANMG